MGTAKELPISIGLERRRQNKFLEIMLLRTAAHLPESEWSILFVMFGEDEGRHSDMLRI